MSDEGEGTFSKSGNSYFIRVPAKVFHDKDFPFTEGEKIKVLLTQSREGDYFIAVEKKWTQKSL